MVEPNCTSEIRNRWLNIWERAHYRWSQICRVLLWCSIAPMARFTWWPKSATEDTLGGHSDKIWRFQSLEIIFSDCAVMFIRTIVF